jgi:hypothetical protein
MTYRLEFYSMLEGAPDIGRAVRSTRKGSSNGSLRAQTDQVAKSQWNSPEETGRSRRFREKNVTFHARRSLGPAVTETARDGTDHWRNKDFPSRKSC